MWSEKPISHVTTDKEKWNTSEILGKMLCLILFVIFKDKFAVAIAPGDRKRLWIHSMPCLVLPRKTPSKACLVLPRENLSRHFQISCLLNPLSLPWVDLLICIFLKNGLWNSVLLYLIVVRLFFILIKIRTIYEKSFSCRCIVLLKLLCAALSQHELPWESK